MPPHHPMRTILAVVGECRLTPMCVAALTQHFDRTPANRGALFEWPPAASVWTDFATGEVIKPSNEPVIMVMQLIAGTAAPAEGVSRGTMQWLQRVMPRLLNPSSVQGLFRGAECRMRVDGMPGAPDVHEIDFWPDFVRATTQRSGMRGVPTVGDLWEYVSDPAGENAIATFEKLMHEDSKKLAAMAGASISKDVKPFEAC